MRLSIWIAFKAFQNVVSLKAQQLCALRGGDGADAGAAQEHDFAALGVALHDLVQLSFVSGIHCHARPDFEFNAGHAGNEANPSTLSMRADVNQHGFAALPPIVGELRADVACVALRLAWDGGCDAGCCGVWSGRVCHTQGLC